MTAHTRAFLGARTARPLGWESAIPFHAGESPALPDRLPGSRLRIVYFNYEWDLRASSGAARHISELTRNLESLGHSVAVYDRHRARGDDGTPALAGAARGVRVRLSPYLHEAAALVRAARGLQDETAIIRRERPDVVLTRYSLHQFSSLLAARRCKVPIVFEVNAPVSFEYRRYRRQYRLLPRLAEWGEAHTLARADDVFVVSNVLKSYLVDRGVAADAVTVVPNGADATQFRPQAADLQVRAHYDRQSVIIGFVGSFAEFHGVEMLRRAIDRVLPIRPNVVFLMVGTGARARDLAAYARAQGFADRVEFAGFVPPTQVPRIVAMMDILLAPYAAEEFFYFSPIKLFEYMASGRAILAARVGQVAEVLADGASGLLYDPTDVAGFTDALLRLIDDPALRARLGVNARAAAQRDYTWRRNAERVAAVLAHARDRGRRELR